MNFLSFYFLMIIFIVSCKHNNSGEQEILSTENYLIENQQCKIKSHDSFNGFMVNGIPSSNFNIDKFTELNRKPDSIIDGYYFYGRSNILFENNKILLIEIVDTNLYFNDFLSIETSVRTIENKFPCSYKNRNKSEYHYMKSDVINLFDEEYNRIKIFIS